MEKNPSPCPWSVLKGFIQHNRLLSCWFISWLCFKQLSLLSFFFCKSFESKRRQGGAYIVKLTVLSPISLLEGLSQQAFCVLAIAILFILNQVSRQSWHKLINSAGKWLLGTYGSTSFTTTEVSWCCALECTAQHPHFCIDFTFFFRGLESTLFI